MRVRAALIVALLGFPFPVSAAAGGQARPLERTAANCPHTSAYLADAGTSYHGPPLAPRKLNELPRGTAYMAVYRRVDGCDAPMTMVEYRNSRRR